MTCELTSQQNEEALRAMREDAQRIKEEQVKNIKDQRMTLDDIHTYVAISNHNKVSKAVSKQLEYEEKHISNLNSEINSLKEMEAQARRRLEKTKNDLTSVYEHLNGVSSVLQLK
jgi:phage-related tail protein